jgi:hypothetical protein
MVQHHNREKFENLNVVKGRIEKATKESPAKLKKRMK